MDDANAPVSPDQKALLATLHRRLGIPTDYGRNPFRPPYGETATLETVGLDVFGRPVSLAPRGARHWRRLAEAARGDGIAVELVSGFRSMAYQAGLIEAKLARGQAIEAILAVNAAPGYSQHHTGLAVDLTTPGVEPLSEAFAATEAFAWLSANAHGFGFSMPYGRNNAFGFVYEPWHWALL